MMHAKIRTGLWIVFWLSNLVTLMADVGPIESDWRSMVRLIFGIVSIVVGVSLLTNSPRQGRLVILVIAGLVIGQWWLIKWGAVLAMWSVRGFAP